MGKLLRMPATRKTKSPAPKAKPAAARLSFAQVMAELEQGLSRIAAHPNVGDVRRRGMMVGIELVRDRATRAEYAYGLRAGHQVCLEARSLGAILRPLGNVVVLMPPLAMTEAELARLGEMACHGIERVTARI